MEENAGAYDEKTFIKLNKYAVDYEAFSFLYGDLTATKKEFMWMRKFDAYIMP